VPSPSEDKRQLGLWHLSIVSDKSTQYGHAAHWVIDCRSGNDSMVTADWSGTLIRRIRVRTDRQMRRQIQSKARTWEIRTYLSVLGTFVHTLTGSCSDIRKYCSLIESGSVVVSKGPFGWLCGYHRWVPIPGRHLPSFPRGQEAIDSDDAKRIVLCTGHDPRDRRCRKVTRFRSKCPPYRKSKHDFLDTSLDRWLRDQLSNPIPWEWGSSWI
jgi:hypothetical protein